MADTLISSEQYRLMCTIERNSKINTTAFTGKEKQDFDFLLKKKYIEPIQERQPIDTPTGFRRIPQTIGYRTTSEGRAIAYTFKATFYKWWIPVLLSIVSIALSIVLHFF